MADIIPFKYKDMMDTNHKYQVDFTDDIIYLRADNDNEAVEYVKNYCELRMHKCITIYRATQDEYDFEELDEIWNNGIEPE